MTAQLRLDWPEAPDFTAESFVDSKATDQARSVLANWRDWPGGAMALVGPEGAGKSHLAAIWAAEAGAAPRAGAADGAPVLVEDVDRAPDERALFSLIEAASAGRIPALLLTARARPADWAVALPDLQSRLRALSFTELHTPDDAALSQILRKLLRDRHLRAGDRVIDYVVARIERSPLAARRAAELLDAATSETGAKVTVQLASRVLRGRDEEWSA